jgi:Flp pilus assembly pilin Flp
MARIQLLIDRVMWTIRRTGDDRGAGLVEYAMLMALIVIVCFAAVTFFGEQTSSKMSLNASCFESQC